MTLPPDAPSLDRLLEHAGWARSLARSLVRDAHAAEDLVQRTWIAALQNPPGGAGSLRAWIAGVLRRLVSLDRRSAARRAARERAAAQPESGPDATGSVTQFELQERLLAAVRALEEPLRSVVWSRYYDGLSPREIARRTGVPVKTVKNRLTRGHQLLRQRLDRAHGGDRGAWCLALMSLVLRPERAALGALLMKFNVQWSVVSVLVVGALGALWWTALGPVSAPAEDPPALAAPVVAPADPAAIPRAASASRSVVAQPESAPAATQVPRASTLGGRVVDLELRGVPGIDVVVLEGTDPASAPMRTDADGGFVLASPDAPLELGVRSDQWVTVLRADLSPRASAPVTIVAAPRRPIAGRVLDSDQQPIAGARLEVRLDRGLRARLAEAAGVAIEQDWSATTDALGRFAFEELPLAAATVHVHAEGHRDLTAAAPERSTRDLVYVLATPERGRFTLRGQVVDAARVAVANVFVATGSAQGRTDREGRFTLEVDERILGNGRRRLTALKPGQLPAVLELPPPAELAARAAHETFTLVLASPALTITGKVVDRDRRPVAAAAIAVVDEEQFGDYFEVIQGTPVMSQSSVERILRGGFSSVDPKTGGDGSFELGGLQDRTYRLRVVDGRGCRELLTLPLRAGSRDLELVLAEAVDFVRVAGIVRALDGTPLGRATVRVLVQLPGVAERRPGPSALTDAAGRFELPEVPRGDYLFEVSAETTLPNLRVAGTLAGGRADQVTLVVPRSCSVQVVLADPERATAFSLLDAAGERIVMQGVHGVAKAGEPSLRIEWTNPRMDLRQGRSDAVVAHEGARTLVLLRDGQEVARVPVTLTPGQVNVLRP